MIARIIINHRIYNTSILITISKNLAISKLQF